MLLGSYVLLLKLRSKPLPNSKGALLRRPRLHLLQLLLLQPPLENEESEGLEHLQQHHQYQLHRRQEYLLERKRVSLD